MVYGRNGGTNTIKQDDAIKKVAEYTSKQRDVIELIIKSTFYGGEYNNHELAKGLEMSYYCRAFNITASGATSGQNPIKNVYSKRKMFNAAGLSQELNDNPELAEENYKKLEDYFRELLYENWPGYPTERPYEMKKLLVDYLKRLYDREQKMESISFDDWKPKGKAVNPNVAAPSKSESDNVSVESNMEAILSSPIFEKCATFAIGILVLLIIVHIIKKLLPGINAYYSEGAAGTLEMVSTLLFYGSIIYVIIIVVKKLEKRKIGIAGAIFVMSFAVADFVEGNVGSVIVEVIIAIVVYEVIKWLTSGNSNNHSSNQTNRSSNPSSIHTSRKSNYAVAKDESKGKKIKLDPMRVIVMIFMCYVGIAGVMNGGNIIIGLVFIGIGISCLSA